MLAGVLPCNLEPITDLPVGVVGKADTFWLGERFNAGCDVDAVAKNVVALDDDVADMHANAQADHLLVGDRLVAFAEPRLDSNGAFHCSDYGREL